MELDFQLLTTGRSLQPLRCGVEFHVSKVFKFALTTPSTHHCLAVLVAFSSFAAAAAATTGKPLTSDIIFPAISLFMLLQFPLAMVCHIIFWGRTFIDLHDSLVWSPRTS